jgi:hypothetical protein
VDLNANLVRFSAGGSVDEHINEEVDVLFVGVTGSGVDEVDGHKHSLRAGTVMLIPKGARRSTRSESGTSPTSPPTVGEGRCGSAAYRDDLYRPMAVALPRIASRFYPFMARTATATLIARSSQETLLETLWSARRRPAREAASSGL